MYILFSRIGNTTEKILKNKLIIVYHPDALEECRKLGLKKVLMVCDKENIGSAKSIQNNGGILENEVVVDGVVNQRYWIELN